MWDVIKELEVKTITQAAHNKRLIIERFNYNLKPGKTQGKKPDRNKTEELKFRKIRRWKKFWKTWVDRKN